MACRLPGDVRSPSDLWDFLVQEKSAQGPVPPERYNLSGFYHPNGNRSGSSNVPGGYFINEDLRQFDNGFFGINNLEATYMDPQQRKLLEVVYEALENSGTCIDALSGSLTGVYVGNFSVDYQPNQTRDPDYIHRYTSTGSGATIMSNRISHVFNLHGPSFTIDTACSSSIYALHQALNAMRMGDCEMAIVATANMVLSPELHVMAAKSGVLSPTGTCHTFDASADGYGRAEGVNAIYIKRLSAALRDGNTIRAVIRGSAVNASGRTPGISLPSGEQQEAVTRKAYMNAELDFAGTDYVECHGTGTPVGDPIEVNAIGSCFAPREGAPLLIGSVKTNVGHSEGASGLTSILKVVMAFENGKIPPSHGVVNINPKLILKERNMKIATKVEEWPRSLRRASINSFGYGGANAHVILESAESYLGPGRLRKQILSNGVPESEKKLLVLPVSAASPKSLEARVQQITQAVAETHYQATLDSLAHTLTKGRDHFRYRSFVLAKTGRKVSAVDEAAASKSANALPFGFVFTGQGAQYAGMASELLAQNEHFRTTIRALDDILKALPAPYAPDWTLEQTLLDGPSTSRINEVTRSQPICTAVQIGLVDLLRSWGIEPSSVVGHSSGEIGAAYAAGLLTFSQAMLVAYYRGYAVGTLRSKGAMLAAGLAIEPAKELIRTKGLDAHVRVACVNAPESVTIAGSPEGIDAIKAELESQNKFVRKLETGGRAYHSKMMEEIGPLYEQLLTPLFTEKNKNAKLSEAARATMYSSVGFNPDELRILDNTVNMATYWRKNLEQPVQFSAALASLAADGKIHLIECGPHAALKGPIQQIRTSIGLDKTTLPYSSTLVRKFDADICMKSLAGTLFTYGHALDWAKMNGLPKSGEGVKTINNLPPYPWDYSAGILWNEPRSSAEQRNRKNIRHELLGTVALTGNGIDFTWRNLLRPSEMPWIKDHKLEDQVVFPGAGYMALAIEAVMQVKDAKGSASKLAFEFRNVNISAALNVPDENDAAAKDLELHTTMSPRRISGANSSVDWCDFSISSWAAGKTMTHCTGSIRITRPVAKTGDESVTVANTEHFDNWPASRWYKQWHEEGFCFGPSFQSLTRFKTDNGQSRREAIGITKLEAPAAALGGSEYPVHPIVIDAAIQAAIWSTTAGQVSTLKAWFPVFISECTIQPAQGAEPDAEAEIHVRSEETGFSSRKMAATLRDARGAPVVDFKDARISLYTGKKIKQRATDDPLAKYMERQPMLRINWKPDILRISSEVETQLRQYVATFVGRQRDDLLDDESLVVIGALIDLAGHKNPRMRVLELGGDAFGYKAKEWLNMLDADTAFSRCKSWVAGDVDESGEPSIQNGAEGPFEVLLIPKHATSKHFWNQDPKCIASLVSDQGIVITRKSDAAVDVLKTAGFIVIDVGRQVLLAIRAQKSSSLQGRNAFVVTAEKPSSPVTEFANALASYLPKTAGVSKVSIISLHQIDTVEIVREDICISLLEMEHEFLATIKPQDTDRLRVMTDNITDLLWVTGANMLGDAPDPNLTLSNGLSRALMLEQPALRFSLLDVGPARLLGSHLIPACDHALKTLVAKHAKDDCEYISKDGLMLISRYQPEYDTNTLFRRRLEPHAAVQKQALASAHPAQLSIGRVGVADTIHFQELSEEFGVPPPGQLDVDVKAVSLDAKDVYAMLGRVDRRDKTTAFAFSGVVTALGPDVKGFAVGDHVVACAPHHLGTGVRVPVGSVHKCLDGENFTTLPTLLLGYATALYALKYRAQLRSGESVLIHDSSNAFGIEAIILAKRIGAVAYATVDSEAKRDYFVDVLGLPASHVFSSLDASFVQGLKQVTSGRGVNVVINSLTGDLLHDSWRSLAEFGRFVEVGSREIDDAGILDMRVFSRNATFTAFDLADLYYAKDGFTRAIWDQLMVETLELYRSGAHQPVPIKIFDVSEVSHAYQYFASNKDRVDKVVISLENPQASVPVVPASYQTLFDPEKVYLLIGCLGGLGRSLSRWMMGRGARRFVFVGRSGADKPSARELISRLESAGATVGVVRGDVSNADDVIAAVQACLDMGRPVGGVVQAAMGLHEALFTRMSNEAWHTGIDPKWKGTWNLHNALEGHDDKLDFFLMTSSVSGTVGTATESNYCAANGFLDSFARWRRHQGKPAISIGLGMISEVGYLHENPEIEALLLRKGIQPINEEEMLQIVDLALRSEAVHDPTEAHLLTGLEPAGIRALSAQGFDVTEHGVLIEARASVLLASLHAEIEARQAASGAASGQSVGAAAPWFKDVPAALTATFASEADAPTFQTAILRLIKKRFSNLILMPSDQIDDRTPLPDFGVDSMIASEFRSWFWTAFKVDIPFLDLMSAQRSLVLLAEFVEDKIPTA
ncbi:polyketide synthase [Zopfia rhizophila CBS 207.26]|uniref:Polyketide synthase n=1 Tax=Zopfia rhizophila CBS 207.26 TaxID=1314779 RepID=A0A6A6DE63_9PEZI|nr:polyketide synthase [Zopfia rhizophila CBS 207.26]